MAGIVSIGVGQCGSQLYTKFWEDLVYEHGIDLNGRDVSDSCDTKSSEIRTFFNVNEVGKYTPRSVFVDLDPEYVDSVRSGPSGPLHNPNNIFHGAYHPIRNWASARYEYGPEEIDKIMDVVRQETERCDSLQGFQLAHSLGGGTGAGLGSLIISTLREEYADKVISTFSVAPSYKVSEYPVEPYSVGFTAHYLISDVDVTYIFDNETLITDLESAGFDPKAKEDAKHLALTDLIAPAMVSSTCAFRFPGQHSNDLRSVVRDLVAVPKLHFLSTVVHMLPTPTPETPGASAVDFSAPLYRPHNETTAVIDPRLVRYNTCAATYRGSASPEQTNDLFSPLRSSQRTTVSHCPSTPRGLDHSVTLVGNHTSVQYLWERVCAEYHNLYRCKRFLKMYMATGMDDMECVEAREDMYALIEEYKQNQGTFVDSEV